MTNNLLQNLTTFIESNLAFANLTLFILRKHSADTQYCITFNSIHVIINHTAIHTGTIASPRKHSTSWRTTPPKPQPTIQPRQRWTTSPPTATTHPHRHTKIMHRTNERHTNQSVCTHAFIVNGSFPGRTFSISHDGSFASLFRVNFFYCRYWRNCRKSDFRKRGPKVEFRQVGRLRWFFDTRFALRAVPFNSGEEFVSEFRLVLCAGFVLLYMACVGVSVFWRSDR